ncbi:MAG: ATP-dependent RNA helicase HrpA, partial [Duodenibacillus sp.]|nr:ATP-dependent RNA helicase HrpA [Duodenibacillus sp.]
IIDEAHERSINIDFLLGYLKRLLEQRPDLKVIVTSATIDAERFAKHFAIDGKPAPVFTIEGRTYPVEIRYRPLGEDADDADDKTLMDAVADACDELEMAGRGDILVFLPGEREIREAADVLARRHRPGMIDILPLYARLSAEDQERIFRPGGLRRIVLATNVAETSLTVPGIRYVVDTGLARVKRYSYRNKVEQLLIEPVSQASANQRAGRCGRVADGICIRLYDENDFRRRPPFTDPEIVRSNLASVILRMKALKLGDPREFPFVERPPARAFADGYDVLHELNAMDRSDELTAIGRELAKLPVDPRLSRMLRESAANGALNEALTIVSGLAVQDPRERPADAQQAADQARRFFAHETSDFMSYLKIWNWWQGALENKESNKKLADLLRRNFLSARRLREWADVRKQLAELAREAGWRVNAAPATYEQLHRALLTGLLGNIGMRELSADAKAIVYAGGHGVKFIIWPGSGLAKKGPKWLMAAEVVETSRLFARCVADIEPEWIEAAAQHLLKKSWAEPHWEKSRGEVVAFEKATLYGVPVYGQRRVSFARHDPALCRELFIREALVEGEFETRAPFFAHNRRLVREIQEIENKSRRLDVLVDESLIEAFYADKLPESVVDAVSFEAWRKEAEKDNPRLLYLSKDELMRHDASGVTTEFFPKSKAMAGVTMALTYHFEPGSPRDGLTMTVPIYALNQIDPLACEWLVPGMLKEKVQSLIKSLPQRMRRHCVPIPDYAARFFEKTGGVQAGRQGLVEALIDPLP